MKQFFRVWNVIFYNPCSMLISIRMHIVSNSYFYLYIYLYFQSQFYSLFIFVVDGGCELERKKRKTRRIDKNHAHSWSNRLQWEQTNMKSNENNSRFRRIFCSPLISVVEIRNKNETRRKSCEVHAQHSLWYLNFVVHVFFSLCSLLCSVSTSL